MMQMDMSDLHTNEHRQTRNRGRGGSTQAMMMDMGNQGEMLMVKQAIMQLKNAVIELQQDREGLRNGIRKLKVENSRLKQKLRRVCDAFTKQSGMEIEDGDYVDDMDLDSLKDFHLLGGPYDPLGLRYDTIVKDDEGKEHKSAERYFWYCMAKFFGDTAAAEKIRTADDTPKAEEAMRAIQNFDETKWNETKLDIWEKAQRKKVEQNSTVANILKATGDTYLAVASQDKVFGTGWRKNREESSRPRMWDGENGGGKVLMKLRDELKAKPWSSDSDKQEAEKKVDELKKTTWRRLRPRDADGNFVQGGRGGMRGGMRGGSRGGMRGSGRGGRGRGGARPLNASAQAPATQTGMLLF